MVSLNSLILSRGISSSSTNLNDEEGRTFAFFERMMRSKPEWGGPLLGISEKQLAF